MNLNKTATGRQTVQAGQINEVLFPFNFKLGTYQLEVNATATCGSSDFLTGSFSKTGPLRCSNPDGVHGDFRPNSTESKVYKCNNGAWEIVQEFLYCNSNRCGDGVLNCGETSQSCPQDFKESAARCDCAGRGFFSQQRINPIQFYDACKTNCSLGCISDFSCPKGYGCADFGCVASLGRCSVKIQDFDYTKEFLAGEPGQAFASVKNNGLIRENITLKLFVDSSNYNQTSFILDEDSERLASLGYRPGVGDHNLELNANADCGATGSVTASFSVKNISIVQASGGLSLATQALLLTKSAEIAQGSQKPISIDIATTRPQIFSLSVSGVPSDWLDYPQTIGVSQEKTINIFVSPKQAGNYTLAITLSGAEQTFKMETAITATGAAVQTAQTSDTTIIVFGALTVLLFGIALFFGHRHLEL